MLFNLKKLVAFYDTRLGRFAKKQIRQALKPHLDQFSKSSYILSLGYSIPFIKKTYKKFNRFSLFFPATQGCFTFSDETGNLSALVYESQLPLPDAIVDGLICMHCFEHTQDTHQLLREIWRVLNGSGKLLLIIPNRRGLWARFDNNPFGFGTSYSKRQIKHLLEDHNFIIESITPTIYAPPSHSNWYHSFLYPIEKILSKFSTHFCGIYMIHAKKQIFQPILKSKYNIKESLIKTKDLPTV